MRIPVANWIAQAIMGILFMLVSLLSTQAFLAWFHGAAWNSTLQTAYRHGKPVMLPIGELINIGLCFGISGLVMILAAVF